MVAGLRHSRLHISMGLTKQYLRFVAGERFGVIASPKGGICFVNAAALSFVASSFAKDDVIVAVPACEDVILWSTKLKKAILHLNGDEHEVTAIAVPPLSSQIAVGYSNGSVNIFDVKTCDIKVTFSGHKSAVTCLTYDPSGMNLASASNDTDIIVWDVVSESGMFRLSGHKSVVTRCRFISSRNILVSSSKDMLVKFWDLDTQHCFYTITAHKSEVWDFCLLNEDKYLVTGSSSSELLVWKITYTADALPEAHPQIDSLNLNEAHLEDKKPKLADGVEDSDEEEENESSGLKLLKCTKVGTILRSGKDRVVSMSVSDDGSLLGCHGSDNNIELFHFATDEEALLRWQKREKRKRKKSKLENGPMTDNFDQSQDMSASAISGLSLQDIVKRFPAAETISPPKAFKILHVKHLSYKIASLLSKNQVQISMVDSDKKDDTSGKKEQVKKKMKKTMENGSLINANGHRGEIRVLSFSSDSAVIMSASAGQLKLWNRESLQCIRTIACGYPLCGFFAPGDRNVILGTKNGMFEIFDLATGEKLEEIHGHNGEVRSLAISSNKSHFASGSSDKSVKFWKFELLKFGNKDGDDSANKTCQLSAIHDRTLQLDEEVISVKFTPNSRLIAVSLLDSTVKIFYLDSLKFFLSLYGHKFPVLCMDISYDSKLIITGSADRNIKIWGLDFGDCHRSLFAHTDNIVDVKFCPQTHLFFSCGKDSMVKQWDADNFERIITLKGHHGDVLCLDVSHDGEHVISSGRDKSLRLWEKTEEPLVLEDERETEREREWNEEDEERGLREDIVVAGQKESNANSEVSLPLKRTISAVEAVDKLLSALDTFHQFKMEQKLNVKNPQKSTEVPLLMKAYQVTTPEKLVIKILLQIKQSEIESTLSLIPFSSLPALLSALNSCFDVCSSEPELLCRICLFLFRIHHSQISTSSVLLPIIDKINIKVKRAANDIRDMFCFNLSGLQLIQQKEDEKNEVSLFYDAAVNFSQKKRRKEKKDRALRRAILTL